MIQGDIRDGNVARFAHPRRRNRKEKRALGFGDDRLTTQFAKRLEQGGHGVAANIGVFEFNGSGEGPLEIRPASDATDDDLSGLRGSDAGFARLGRVGGSNGFLDGGDVFG